MYLKLADGSYFNPENGTQYSVAPDDKNAGEFHVKVSNGTWGKFTTGRTLAEGYRSREDALAALDEFAMELDYKVIQPPYSEEEEGLSTEDSDPEAVRSADFDGASGGDTSSDDTDSLPGKKMGGESVTTTTTTKTDAKGKGIK